MVAVISTGYLISGSGLREGLSGFTIMQCEDKTTQGKFAIDLEQMISFGTKHIVQLWKHAKIVKCIVSCIFCVLESRAWNCFICYIDWRTVQKRCSHWSAVKSEAEEPLCVEVQPCWLFYKPGTRKKAHRHISSYSWTQTAHIQIGWCCFFFFFFSFFLEQVKSRVIGYCSIPAAHYLRKDKMA